LIQKEIEMNNIETKSITTTTTKIWYTGEIKITKNNRFPRKYIQILGDNKYIEFKQVQKERDLMDGGMIYYLDGERHRLNGPAMVSPGYKPSLEDKGDWVIEGKRYTFWEYLKEIKRRGIKDTTIFKLALKYG
jgi:hypothetical protein